LSHYENSFFFFLKRFFTYNTLAANSVYSKKQLKNEKLVNSLLSQKNNTLSGHFFLTSFFLKSRVFIFPDLSILHSEGDEATFEKKSNSLVLLKDLFLIFNDSELFYKTNLNHMAYLTSTNGGASEFQFFLYFGTPTTVVSRNKFVTARSKTPELGLNTFMYLSVAQNTDNSYLRDIAALYYFY
jgi:hypothetical protein